MSGVTIHLWGEYFFGLSGRHLLKSREGEKRLFRRMGSVHHSRLQFSINTSRLTKFLLMVAEVTCHLDASRL